MLLTYTNGWPLTFNLQSASRIADTTVSALRTRIARNILRFAGVRPLAGDQRSFNIAAIYEIALCDEMERNGIRQTVAAAVIENLYDHQVRLGLHNFNETNPGVLKLPALEKLSTASLVEGENPARWIPYCALGSRDLSRPQLLIFASSFAYPLTAIADGWGDVQAQVTKLQNDAALYLVSEEHKAADPAFQRVNAPEVVSRIPMFSIVNLSAVLANVDRRVLDFFDGKQPEVLPLHPTK